MRMNNFYIETRFADKDFKEKEVARFAQTYPGAIVMKPNYSSEKELDDDWAKFNDMGYDKKFLSNNKAMELYGMRNEDVYDKFKHEFLKTDIKNSKILDKTYIPSGINDKNNTVYSIYSEATIVKDYRGLTIAENYAPSPLNYALAILDAMNESDDNIEKIFLYDTLNSINEDSTVIDSLKEYGYKKLTESINTPDPDIEYPMGNSIDSFFTINEIYNIEDIKKEGKTDSAWMHNFLARSYGLRPAVGKNGEINLKTSDLVPGWNPILPYTELNRKRSLDRLNYMYSQDLFSNSHFINIYNFKGDKSSLDESNSMNPTVKGISVYFIHGELDDGDNDTPRIAISLDNTSDMVIPILNGELSQPALLKDILNNYEWANIVLFFLPVEDGLYDKLYNNISCVVDRQEKPRTNFLKDISDDMECPNAIVANDKVFYMFLINSILELGRANQNDISSLNIDNRLFWNKKPNYTYLLFKGNKDNFNRDNILSKLDFYKTEKLSVSPNHVNEGYFRMKKTDLQVLNESNEVNEPDYLNRIPFKEVSELLNQYSIE